MVPAVGGIVGAIVASSCCIVPLALFILGISGAWISHLTALEPYQPIFIAVAMGFLGTGYYRVVRKPRVGCVDACAHPLPNRIVKSALWAATALLLIAIAFPYLAPALLGV